MAFGGLEMSRTEIRRKWKMIVLILLSFAALC
jgi:hypothetical protein